MSLICQSIPSSSHTYLCLPVTLPQELKFWLWTPCLHIDQPDLCLAILPNITHLILWCMQIKHFFQCLCPLKTTVVCFQILWHFLAKPLLGGIIINSQPNLRLRPSHPSWIRASAWFWLSLVLSLIYSSRVLMIFSVKATLHVPRVPIPAVQKLPEYPLTCHTLQHPSVLCIFSVVLLFCFCQRWQNKSGWIFNTANLGKEQKEKVCINKYKILALVTNNYDRQNSKMASKIPTPWCAHPIESLLLGCEQGMWVWWAATIMTTIYFKAKSIL